MNGLILLIVFAAIAVVVLSAYAAYLWQQVYAQRQFQAEKAAELQKQQRYWLDSVQTIARVIVQEQANITECAMRIKVLMDRLYNNDCPKTEFRPLYELAWATSHMPIRQQRKSFSRQQIKAFDTERERLEEQMQDDVKVAAQAILDYDFSNDFPALEAP